MGCNEAPVAQRARDDCMAQLPGVTSAGIIGDQSHQLRRSSHNCAPMQESGPYNPNYAHAWDAHHGGVRALADRIRMAFLRDSRTRYVIDNGIGYYPDGGWFYSYDHEFHVHWSARPGTTFDTRPFDFLGGATPTTEGWGTMTDAEIRAEFANQDDRIVARVVAELAGTKAKPAGLAATQQRIIRKLNRLLTAAGLKTDG